MTARHDERGSFTLWTVGLCVMLLMIGGVSIDLWRAFAERRALAAMADAAAVAGASALNETAFRTHGSIELEPDAAESRASANLIAQSDFDKITGSEVAADAERVLVRLTGKVDFVLVRLLAAGDAFAVNVTATAEPRQSA